jgi:hypothetical protein
VKASFPKLAQLAGVATLLAVSSHALLRAKVPAPHLDLTPPTLTQSVAADFDGDRRPDAGTVVAAGVQLRLSGFRQDRLLAVPEQIFGLIAVDIDRDGDVDLVANLAHGGVIVWLNDGHGRFDRAVARRAPPGLAASRLSALVPFAPVGLMSRPDVLGTSTDAPTPLQTAAAVVRDRARRSSRLPIPSLPVRGPPAPLL